MQSSIFAVNDEPYCLWEVDLLERTREYLEGLDPEHFDHVLQTNLESDDEGRLLVVVRMSLHHAIETMFSLLGAFIQAPDCPYAWIAKCSNPDLREVVGRVSRRDATLISKLHLPTLGWHSVAEAVFTAYQSGTERQLKTMYLFGRLWEALARELTNQTNIDEYNALKHGFRARPGGFSLAAGVEKEAPNEAGIHMLGRSAFGATFLKVESLGSNKGGRHIRSRQLSVNWSLERVVMLHQLVYMSINNVVSALKVVNDVPAGTCRFLRPENDDDFDKPWTFSTGVTSFTMDHVIDERGLPSLTKDELLSALREK